jgi:hypothetical protein
MGDLFSAIADYIGSALGSSTGSIGSSAAGSMGNSISDYLGSAVKTNVDNGNAKSGLIDMLSQKNTDEKPKTSWQQNIPQAGAATSAQLGMSQMNAPMMQPPDMSRPQPIQNMTRQDNHMPTGQDDLMSMMMKMGLKF